jgi:hypothetical protein
MRSTHHLQSTPIAAANPKSCPCSCASKSKLMSLSYKVLLNPTSFSEAKFSQPDLARPLPSAFFDSSCAKSLIQSCPPLRTGSESTLQVFDFKFIWTGQCSRLQAPSATCFKWGRLFLVRFLGQNAGSPTWPSVFRIGYLKHVATCFWFRR